MKDELLRRKAEIHSSSRLRFSMWVGLAATSFEATTVVGLAHRPHDALRGAELFLGVHRPA